jgi:hypothetical protein
MPGDRKAFKAEIETLLKRDRASIKKVDAIIQTVSRKQDPASREKLRDLRWFKNEIQKSAKAYETILKRLG